MAMDRTSSVIELPDNSGYLAASDVSSPGHSPSGNVASPSGRSFRNPRISIESDYAVPFTSPQRLSVPSLRQSAPSLWVSASSPTRSASMFLPDGSGYMAAGGSGDRKVTAFASGRLGGRRGGRPLSLDIERARERRLGSLKNKKSGSEGRYE